jgi:hypothetical protein
LRPLVPRLCDLEKTMTGRMLRQSTPSRPLRSWLALLAFVVIACLPGTARADNVGPQGGLGGGAPFAPLQCPAGMFMLGVALHSGAWIDAIRANCLAYNPSTDQFVAPPQFTAFAGGSGGGLQQNGCSPERYLSAIKIGYGQDATQPHLDYVQMSCTVLSGYGGDVKVCLHTGKGCWDTPPSRFPFPVPAAPSRWPAPAARRRSVSSAAPVPVSMPSASSAHRSRSVAAGGLSAAAVGAVQAG